MSKTSVAEVFKAVGEDEFQKCVAELSAAGRCDEICDFLANSGSVAKSRVLFAIEEIGKNCHSLTASGGVKKFLESQQEPMVLASFISALKGIHDVALIPLLANFLASPDKRVRANTVETISEISSSDDVRALLFPFLQDQDNRVKANTALALWKYAELRGAIRDVFDGMTRDERKWMRASAYYAFGEIGLVEFINRLLDGLDDKDEDACKTAVVALIGYCERFAD